MELSPQQNKYIDIVEQDSVIFVRPVLPEIKKKFTLVTKTMAPDPKQPYKQVVTREVYEAFNIVVHGGENVMVLPRGFLTEIKEFCNKKGIKVRSHADKRICCVKNNGIAPPNFDAMFGFRFSQRELLEEFLSADQSGLCGAPTRYGKTTLIKNTLRAYPNLYTCLVVPGVDLLRQTYDDMVGAKLGREIKIIGGGSRQKPSTAPNGINIASADSLDKIDCQAVELLLVDEPHAMVTPRRLKGFAEFTKARRLGYGATLKGRFDGKDRLITGLFGDVLAQRTFREAVDEGAICMIKVLMLRVKIKPIRASDRTAAYRRLLFKNRVMSKLIGEMCHKIIPEDFQTMIFINNEDQADLYIQDVGMEHTIAMAKKMSNKEREEVTHLMRSNKIKRCLCTNIYVQGVTFSDVRVIINAAGGGSNTSTIQKPGRLAEIRPDTGKKYGIMIDFLFEQVPNDGGMLEADNSNAPFMALCRDSKARLGAYKEIGYDVQIADDMLDLRQKFNDLHEA